MCTGSDRRSESTTTTTTTTTAGPRFRSRTTSRWRRFATIRQSIVSAFLLLLVASRTVDALCPPKCVCNDDTLVVKCERANLENVPILLNPYIQHLLLGGNNITSVFDIFRIYRALQYLDLGNNKLVAIETESFKMQSNLTVLKLNRNEISHLRPNTFVGLHNLAVLHLDDNILETLPDNAFDHLGHLESLDVSANQIGAIGDAAFAGLGQLRTLRLADNRLQSVPTHAFRSLERLHRLDIGANQLLTLPAQAFAPLVALLELTLDECGLRRIDDDAFHGLGRLRTLRLRDNHFDAIPVGSWPQIAQLEEIYLGQNRFVELAAGSFDRLTRLRSVDVSGCRRLAVIRSRAFANNTDLRRAIFDHNPRLRLIEPTAFDGARSSLRQVSLRDDAFRTFAEEQLPWDELASLDLRDNPIECNCSLLWLRSLLVKRNLTLDATSADDIPSSSAASTLPEQLARDAIRCRTPGSLDGRRLVDASTWDLGCNFADAGRQALVGVIALALAACLVVIVLAVYKHVKRMTSVLKGQWTDGALRHKDGLHYEKTNAVDEEESNILHAAHQSLKMTPVTEL